MARAVRGPVDNLDTAERAPVGLRHAVWAAVVSGAMNGRMLWWADGYDQYEKPDPNLRTRFAHLAEPAARFVGGIDFAGFKPIAVEPSPDVYGAAIGHHRSLIAWFRDAQCVGPEWPTRRLDRQRIVLAVPGDAERWRFIASDPVTLEPIAQGVAHREKGKVSLWLPPFEDAVVLRLTADAASP